MPPAYDRSRPVRQPGLLRWAGAVAVAFAALLAGACAGGPKIAGAPTLAQANPAGEAEGSAGAQTELQKAIDYWGKEHAKNPRDLKSALSYARNLKAAAQKDQALAVLQAASIYHGANRELTSEYGRLALDLGQTGLAEKLLAAADDPAKPDWRVISARGTAFAKQNQYRQAIPLYERALLLSPDQPSVLSNLAMAHAANGEAPRAEALLRQAAEKPDSDPKVRQNLALVLGLQGKYDEARKVSAQDIPVETAAADVEYVRQMVRLEPQGAVPIVAAVAKPAAPQATVQTAAAKRAPSDAGQLRGGTTETPASDVTGTWATDVADAKPAGLKPSKR
jgi:Flp pilus assembly protein TadD